MSEDQNQADREDQDQADRKDEADREDLADLADQEDRGDQDGKGDRGRRGVQGMRGRAGADSGSVQVLTGVLDGLRSELKGLRSAVQTERKGRRLSLIIIGIAFVVTALVVAAGWVGYSHDNKLERNRNSVQVTTALRSSYDQQVALHEACVSRGGARSNVRDLFLSFYDLIGSTKPAKPRTPQEQAVIDGFLRQSRKDVQDKLPPIDCDDDTPLPKGKRP